MEKIKVPFIYLVLAVFALRGLLFTPGIIGHNWDWSIPWFSSNLVHMFKESFYLWWDFSFGQVDILHLSLLPFHFFLTVWGFLGLNGEIVSKGLVLTTVFLAGFMMFLLAEDILGEVIDNHKEKGVRLFSAFFAGLFYGFSPFLFQDLIGGAGTAFIAYALFPLAFLLFRRERLISTALVLSLMIISLQSFVLAVVFFFGYSVVCQKREILFIFRVLLLTLAFNLYWILPAVFSYQGNNLPLGSGNNEAMLDTIRYNVPSLREIFIATGYFRPLFTMSIIPEFLRYWKFFSYLFVIVVVFIANLFFSGKKRPLFWLAFLLFSFIPATGAKNPFGDIVLWLYANFPLMALFRSPQHFLVWPTFGFAVLIGTGIIFLQEKVSKYNQLYRALPFVLFLVMVVWLHPFLVYGDLGREQLKKRYSGGNYLDVFQLSPDFREVIQFLESRKDDRRVLVLPMAASPYYLPTSFQSQAQGGDPQVFRSSMPMITADFMSAQPSSNFLEMARRELYVNKNQLFLKNLLFLSNIGYVILRRDVLDNSGLSAFSWDYLTVRELLDKSPYLEKIKEGDLVTLYRVKETLSPTHFYVPGRYFRIFGGEAEARPAAFDDLNDGQPAYFFDEENNNFDKLFIPIGAKTDFPAINKEGESETFLQVIFSPIANLISLTDINLAKEPTYPYVRIKPGTLLYSFLRLKEKWSEDVQKNPLGLFNLKLLYAMKRVGELERWEKDLNDKDKLQITDGYFKKMEEALALLRSLKASSLQGLGPLLLKYQSSLDDGAGRLEKINPTVKEKIEKLRKELTEVGQGIITKDSEQFTFTVPRQGNYEFYLGSENYPPGAEKKLLEGNGIQVDDKDIIQAKKLESGWMMVGEIPLTFGVHTASLPQIKENLLNGESWRDISTNQPVKTTQSALTMEYFPQSVSDEKGFVNDLLGYKQHANYHISLAYRVKNGRAGVIVVEERKSPDDGGHQFFSIVSQLLPISSGDKTVWFNADFIARPGAIGAKLYLVLSPDSSELVAGQFSDVQIKAVWKPSLFARLTDLNPPVRTTPPKIFSTKLNPTEYHLTVSGVKDPYTVVFSESFHPEWKMFLAGSQNPLPEEKHHLVNGFANAWDIAPEDAGGKQDYEIEVRFIPQDKVPISLAISLTAIFLAVGLRLWQLSRKTGR